MKNNITKTKFFSAKRIATLSVLTAMGLIMFMVESLFPPLILPGAKMGLSNIFSMLAVFLLGPSEALVLVVVRTVLGSMFTGNMSTLMYSLTAGVVSVAVSSVLVQLVYPRVSIVAISIVSAVMHNLTQNVVFCLVSNTPEMFSYMPWLALLGVLAGVIVGFAVWFILKMIPTRTFASLLEFELSEQTAPQPEIQSVSDEATAGKEEPLTEQTTETNHESQAEQDVDTSGGVRTEQSVWQDSANDE